MQVNTGGWRKTLDWVSEQRSEGNEGLCHSAEGFHAAGATGRKAPSASSTSTINNRGLEHRATGSLFLTGVGVLCISY